MSKTFDTKFVTPFSNAFYIALRWSARRFPIFSIDMLLRWSKEVSLQIKISLRQRHDISIEIKIARRCKPKKVLCVLTRCLSG